MMGTFVISVYLYVDTGLGSLFVAEAPGAVNTTIPGVPAIPTMLCFILIGIAGLITVYNPKPTISIFWLGAIVTFIGSLAALGYLIGAPLLYYSFVGYTAMAFHTAVLFVLLGVAMMRCR